MQVDEINMQNLKAVAYTIIVNLIDQISAKQIAEYPFLLKKVRTYYNQRAVSKEAVSKIRKEDFDAAVNASVLKNYKLDNRMSRMSKEKLLDCVRFLYQCKLINITVYNPESESRLDSFSMVYMRNGIMQMRFFQSIRLRLHIRISLSGS